MAKQQLGRILERLPRKEAAKQLGVCAGTLDYWKRTGVVPQRHRDAVDALCRKLEAKP